MGNPAFAEVHLVHLFSFHESWLRGSNVLGWYEEKWPRPTPIPKAVRYVRNDHLFSTSVTRRPSLPPSYPPSFLQSEKLLSSCSWFHPFPFFSSLFWISSPPSIPSFPTKNLCTSPLCWKTLLYNVLSPQGSTVNVQSLPITLNKYSAASQTRSCMWIAWGMVLEHRVWFSKGPRICISTEHPGDAMWEDSQYLHSWLFTHPLSADVHFFYLTKMVPKVTTHLLLPKSNLCPQLL